MKHTWMLILVAAAAVSLAAAPAKDQAARTPAAPDAAPAKAPSATRGAPAKAPPAEAESEPVPVKPAAAPAGESSRPPVGIEDLKALYREAPTVVQFQAEAVTGKPGVAERLAWEVRGPVVEVIKGSLLPGRMFLHVDSPLRVFDMPRDQIEGGQFVVAIKPLTGAGDRRFQLVGPCAFPADGREAEALRQLAKSEADSGSGGTSLQLTIKTLDKADRAFPIAGPKIIEVRLTNTGADSATYLQAPLCEKEGKLYLTGAGSLLVRDTTGHLVKDKGNVVMGQAPPPPPRPALILPNASFVENLDLARFYDLSEGRYTLSLALATPDLHSRVVSNGFSFQVGAVNLPAEAPPRPKVEPVRLPETAPERPAPEKVGNEAAGTDVLLPPRPVAPAVNVPDPAKYTPGKATAGLAALLRPAKAKFVLGDPVDLEFRLINVGPRSLAVDARLERCLTIQVQSVGDSPQPLFVRQVIPWPADATAMPEERSFLREGAFWGRIINLNTLYGKSLDDLPAPTPEEIAAGKALTYERYGKNLFGFSKPGHYNVSATYAVTRPHTADGKQPVDQPKEWWIGDLQTNTITIQVGEPGK